LQRCNKNLAGNNIIRKISAAFLLLLFALCVTPKIALHDLIADHKDSPFASATSSQQLSSNSGFRCNCDDLVVESPFVSDCVPVEITPVKTYARHFITPAENFRFLHHFYFELRGPPSVA